MALFIANLAGAEVCNAGLSVTAMQKEWKPIDMSKAQNYFSTKKMNPKVEIWIIKMY